jgi:carbon storage regulator
MLVLTRKLDQKIVIGKNIVITVLKVQGDQVSIGIEAPRSTTIYREEIFREIERANAGGVIQKDSSVDVKKVAKGLKGALRGGIPSQLSSKKGFSLNKNPKE